MEKLFICLICLVTLSLCCTFTACNKEMVVVNYEDPNYGNDDDDESTAPEEANVAVSAKSFNISAIAGKIKNIVIISNQTQFTIAPSETDWYSTEFVGKALIITTKTTNDGEEQKSQEVTLTAGESGNTAETTFVILQNTMKDEPAEISVGQTAYTLGGKQGDELRIPLVSNQATFTSTPTASWYTTSFDGSTLVITSTEANTTGALRSAEVTVTAGTDENTADVTFTLNQALKPEVDPLIGTIRDGGIIYYVNRITGKYKAAALIDGNPNFSVYWQQKDSERVLVGADDTNDGRNNVPIYKATPNFSIYVAVKYCDDKAPAGTWYLPAKNEVQQLYENIDEYGREAFNATIASNNGHTFNYEGKTYWTSTERTATNVYCLRFSDGKWMDQSKTSAARHIRCIMEGDIE